MANYKNIVPFIKKAEGGLSRQPADSASSNPAPWSYNGVSGYHTNKGVTYTTFISMAPALGYAITPENFFVMPDEIWGLIFKKGYWDKFNLDKMNSQAIANLVADSAWGSGVGGTLNMLKPYLSAKGYSVTTAPQATEALNSISKGTEQKTFDELVQLRKNFFISLNQPVFIKGWLSRLDKLSLLGHEEIFKKKPL